MSEQGLRNAIAWDQLNGRIALVVGAWVFWYDHWVASLTPEQNWARLYPLAQQYLDAAETYMDLSEVGRRPSISHDMYEAASETYRKARAKLYTALEAPE